jgi:hypothetical protein
MFLEEEQDEREAELDEDEEGYLEEEETLEELDVDDRGHVRPRRSRFDDDEGDGLYEEADPEF